MFHTAEVFSRRAAGGGFPADGAVYFLLEYSLYRKAKGIAAFPDGGLSEMLFEKTFLFRYMPEEKKVEHLYTLSGVNQPGGDVRHSMFRRDGKVLQVLYRYRQGSTEDSRSWKGLIWDLEKDEGRELAAEETRILFQTMQEEGGFAAAKERLTDLGEIRERLKGTLQRDWELPSPLDYSDKSDRAYGKDLVLLRGDRYYRNEIIAGIIAGEIDLDPSGILKDIEKRKERLEGYKRDSYVMYISETEEKLAY
jgi:hypothetical protein